MTEHRSRHDSDYSSDKTAPQPGTSPEDIQRFLSWASYIASALHEDGRAKMLRDLVRTLHDAARFDRRSSAEEQAQFKLMLNEAEDYYADVTLGRAPKDWLPFTD
jgi:hypothetical protein